MTARPQSVAANYTPADRTYVEAHGFMFGDLGRHVATAAILFRDRVLRPGLALPVIRVAPVAPYGGKRGLSGNGCSLEHVERHGLDDGIWLYLHRQFWDEGRFLDDLDEVVLHELLHNELRQLGESPKHKGEPWARRCRELSARLGLDARIERPRSVRAGARVTTGCPAGCLPYADLSRWPGRLLRDGPSLRARALSDGPAVVCSDELQTEAVAA